MSKARDIADLGSNDVLETTSTGLDVTGTVTADGLTVDGTATFTTADNNAQVSLVSTDTDALVGPTLNLWRNSGLGSNGDLIGQVTFTGEDSVGSTNTFATVSSVIEQASNGSEDGSLHFKTLLNGTLANRLSIGSGSTGGNVEFYEDTGTTAKMVWDASAERLSVPTLSITDGAITTTAAAGDHTVFNSTGADADFRVRTGANTHSLYIEGNTGNVGIGTASPSQKLEVASGNIELDSGYSLFLGSDSNVSVNSTSSTRALTFQTAGTERARLDSSGNLLVGSTVTPTTNTSSGNIVGGMFSSSSHTVADVGSTFVNSGFSVGNTRASYLVTISGGAPNNGSALATYIFTKAAYDAELVQLGNTASHYGNVSIEAQRSSSSSSTVNLQVRFTGVNLTGTGPITTNAIRIG